MAASTQRITDFTKAGGDIVSRSDVDDTKIYRFPVVMSKHKTTKADNSWTISVVANEYDPEDSSWYEIDFTPQMLENTKQSAQLRAVIVVDSGKVGGKVRDVVPTYVEKGKNIGRSNETNVFCQAISQARQIYNKQSTAKTVEPDRPLPMLADSSAKAPAFDFQNSKYFVQRKFNGVRCIAYVTHAHAHTSDVILYSRQKKEYPGFQELKDTIAKLLSSTPHIYLDGELYKHGLSLNKISGITRSSTSDEESQIEYHVYDCFSPTQSLGTYSDRLNILKQLLGSSTSGKVHLVKTTTVKSESQLAGLYKKFLSEGYEGAMLRLDREYVHTRTSALIKYKPAFDDEFEIVDWSTGEKGKASDALMLRCKTKDNKEFNVTPTGTMVTRRELAAKFGNQPDIFNNEWKGKMLTVTYDELSPDKIPQRARTDLVIRDYE
jgi:DNA ligase 1